MVDLPNDPEQLAELTEMTGEELVARGEQMLKLGQRLLMQATELRSLDGVVTLADNEDRAVGRNGEVFIADAIRAVRELTGEHGKFTRALFQERTGLNPGQAMKFLTRLLNNEPRPIIERDGRCYRYTGPAEQPAPRERPESAREVEQKAGVGADRHADGRTVPYTGRPMGSTGKPGLDKKLSQVRRVRRSTGQILGG